MNPTQQELFDHVIWDGSDEQSHVASALYSKKDLMLEVPFTKKEFEKEGRRKCYIIIPKHFFMAKSQIINDQEGQRRFRIRRISEKRWKRSGLKQAKRVRKKHRKQVEEIMNDNTMEVNPCKTVVAHAFKKRSTYFHIVGKKDHSMYGFYGGKHAWRTMRFYVRKKTLRGEKRGGFLITIYPPYKRKVRPAPVLDLTETEEGEVVDNKE